MSGPLLEAFGRVTNPQRYGVLYEVARQLLDDLTERYLVTRVPWGNSYPTGVPPEFVGEVVKLSPPPGNGGPVGIVFTKFPGLIVRYGRWRHSSYPHCGCDACDESPEQLAEELRGSVEEFITSNVTEQLRWGLRPALLYKVDGERWHWQSLRRNEARGLGRPERLTWPPWPLR